MSENDRTVGNGTKLEMGGFSLDVGRKFFSMKIVRAWDGLPKEVVEASSLRPLKIRLDGTLSNLI